MMAMAVVHVFSKKATIVLIISTLLTGTVFYWPRLPAIEIEKSLSQHATTVPTVAPLFADPGFNSSGSSSCTELGRQPDRKRAEKRTGFILSLAFREQQTMAAANLYSLQCWAQSMPVSIVEPFVSDSRLVVPLASSQRNMLRFSDLFDLRQWDKLTSTLGFPPLALWERFLSDAPRNLIVVHMQYSSSQKVQQRVMLGEAATHLAFSNAYKQGCLKKEGFSEQLAYLKRLNFIVVREVCVNFAHGDELTVYQFNHHILGPHQPSEVTILLDEWRGFTARDNGKRVVVSDGCSSAHLAPYLLPSLEVYCDARHYQNMFLHSSPYIAVIIRIEKIRLTSSLTVQQCLQRTLDKLNKIPRLKSNANVVLSMDVGKYGSSGTREEDLKDYNGFLSAIYGSNASISMWENSFEQVTERRDPGYIASLQKVLVAQARCVIVVGGGSFQKHTLFLHKYHSQGNGQSLCVYVVRECSRNMGTSDWKQK